MNYSKIYDDLILKRQTEIITKGEKHHIIPKCIGGSNDRTNIVVLTPREHVVAHFLLWKIYPNNNKIIYTVIAICNFSSHDRYNHIRYIPNSRLIARSRELNSSMASKRFKGKGNPNYDKTLFSFINRDTREIVRMTKNDFFNYSELTRPEINNLTNYNHRYSHNWGLVGKDGVASFDIKKYSPPIKDIDKIQCLYCLKRVDKRNYKRWHGDKCKFKS